MAPAKNKSKKRKAASRTKGGKGSTEAAAPQDIDEEASDEQQACSNAEMLDDINTGGNTADITEVAGVVTVLFSFYCHVLI
jgi:hypothetical protein